MCKVITFFGAMLKVDEKVGTKLRAENFRRTCTHTVYLHTLYV